MTTNRARKRVARAIAASQNIRYPEAAALADGKTVRNPPRTLHVFDDPDDPRLALATAALNSLTDLTLAPGVTGSGQARIELVDPIVRGALGVEEATAEQNLDPADLQRIRILFARRYADLIDARLDGVMTLGLLEESLDSAPGLAAKKLSQAISHAQEDFKTGAGHSEAWWPHKDLLGVHLYQMLKAMDSVGQASSLLRNAAVTMEAELRLGIA